MRFMKDSLLNNAVARESSFINAAIDEALDLIPVSCRPVAKHIMDAGGKRLRPFLTVTFAKLFGYDGQDIYRLAASMEFLHAATLLHDDVLDNAAMRRGIPCAQTIYGPVKTILAGDAMLACGNLLVAQYDDPTLCRYYSEATACTAAGEVLEMESLGQVDMGHEQYIEIARGKTGRLMAEACRLGAARAKASAGQIALSALFGENLGVAFQIIDDCLDFAPQADTGKPCGGDLREGKMTPPIRLFRENLPQKERDDFDRFFTSSKNDKALLDKYVSEISRHAGQARNLAGQYLDCAGDMLKQLPDNRQNEILLNLVSEAAFRKK